MAETVRVTISLPKELAEFADSMAKRARRRRSRFIAGLIEEKKQQLQHEKLIEGYKAMAEENRKFAKDVIHLSREALAFEPPYPQP